MPGEEREPVPADLSAKRQHLALADPRRADHGEKVALPLARHANTQFAHADKIFDVAVIVLNLDSWKYQRAFGVHVDGGAHIGGRQCVAAIGLMRLGQNREAMHAVIVDHRYQDGVIGGV